MRLISVSAKNFLSFKSLEYNFNDGLVLLDGWNHDQQTANGAGKTAIFDLTMYCLFGKTARNVKTDELIRYGVSSMTCGICVENGSETINIVRERNPNSFVVSINGVPMVCQDANDLQYKLNKKLGINYKTFLYSVYLSQLRTELFISSGDEEQKSTLLDICEFNIYEQGYKKVQELLKNKNTELYNRSEQLNNAEKSLHLSTLRIVELKHANNNFEANREKDLSFIDIELKNIDNDIQNYNKELAGSQYDADGYAIRHERYVKAVELNSDLDNKIKKQAELFNLVKNQKEQIITIQEEMKVLHTNRCPTCKQNLPVDSLLVSDKKISFASIGKTLVTQHAMLCEIESYVSQNEKNIKKELIDSKVELEKYTLVKDTSEKIYHKLSCLSNRQRSLINQKDEVQVRKNDYTDLIFKEKCQIDDLESESKDVSKIIDSLKDEVFKLEATKEVLGPQGVRSVILDSVINSLNRLSNDYISKLFNSTMQIKFSIEKIETKTAFKQRVIIDLFDGSKNIKFDSLSGGEKRRVIIAVDFALSDIVSSRTNKSFNVLFLDEITEGLDAIGREKLFSLLKEMSVKKNIICIDHAVEYKNLFDHIVTVEKRNNESRLV